MLSMVKIWNAPLTSSCLLNELNPVRFPVEKFTWTQPTKGDPLPKMEEAGQHPRFSDVDVMSIDMEGHILGNSTSDYWTNRKELIGVVIPDPTYLHQYRYHSRLDVKIDGDNETYYAYVILKEYEIPLEALYPTVTPFQFQWENVVGYWRKLSNNAVALI